MDRSYIDRTKERLVTMRRVAEMAHDPRAVELVTVTADELEDDILKLEAEGSSLITIHLEPPSES